jgi:hypothetical protein
MPNMNMHERVIRMFLGVIISSFLIYLNSVWAVAGLVPFITGIIGYCPLYALLGFNRNRTAAGH